MKNVIENLKFMSRRSNDWYIGTISGLWIHGVRKASADSGEMVRFTQGELREFIKHYEELSNEKRD